MRTSKPAARRVRQGAGADGKNRRADCFHAFGQARAVSAWDAGAHGGAGSGVDIDSVCGGRAICGRCQVNVGEGEFAKHGITSAVDHLSAFSKVEERYDKLRGLASGRRLSCQTQLLADVVIDVPPESQVHKQVVRKAAEVRDIEMDPATRLYFIEVEEADMHKPSSDLERVYRALAEQWDVRDLTCNLNIISRASGRTEEGRMENHLRGEFARCGWRQTASGNLARLP